jgi:crossover junction endodeoxyribonuclease RusA
MEVIVETRKRKDTRKESNSMELFKQVYIPGIPDIKMRPRATKKGQVYDPNAEAKEASIQKARLAQGYEGIFRGALSVSYTFVFPRPKSHFRTGKFSNVLRDNAPSYCDSVSKDLDNLEKFYADSFNSIHYVDDRQIVIHDRSFKRWVNHEENEVPHVFMIIRALESEREQTI